MTISQRGFGGNGGASERSAGRTLTHSLSPTLTHSLLHRPVWVFVVSRAIGTQPGPVSLYGGNGGAAEQDVHVYRVTFLLRKSP